MRLAIFLTIISTLFVFVAAVQEADQSDALDNFNSAAALEAYLNEATDVSEAERRRLERILRRIARMAAQRAANRVARTMLDKAESESDAEESAEAAPEGGEATPAAAPTT